MRLAYMQFAKGIRWRLGVGSPKTFALTTNSEWSVINPLLYGQLPDGARHAANVLEYGRGMALVTSRHLVLIREDEAPGTAPKEEFPQLQSEVGSFLRRLRHVSGQADMPKEDDLVAVLFGAVDALPEFAPIADGTGQVMIQSYVLSASVSMADVAAAEALPADFIPPIYSVLMLDGISAFLAHDYRVAILFAAMTMEIAFGTALDAAYEAILAAPADPRFRVLKIPIGGGNFSVKDPIYDRLREKQDFSVRIHEMALYLLGRSVRQENDVLYKKALKLYRTRNKIVHLGSTEEAMEEVFPVDRGGGFESLEIAADSLTWLGLNPGIKLPRIQFLQDDEFKRFAQSLDGTGSSQVL